MRYTLHEPWTFYQGQRISSNEYCRHYNCMAIMEREMRILMSSSLDMTSANLNDIGGYFFDPFDTAAKALFGGHFTETSWSLLGGKEILRVLHSDQLFYCPWYHRLFWFCSRLSSLGQNIGLDDIFSFFYQIESPMFAVDFKMSELRRVQFGQIKVRATIGPGGLQMNIGGSNCNKEIWNQRETFAYASFRSIQKNIKDIENIGSI